MPPARRPSPLRLIALLFVAGCIAVAVGLVAAFAAGHGPWIELLRYPPWPLMLAPLTVAVFVAVAAGWRWVLAVMGAIAVFWFGVLGFVVGRADAPLDQPAVRVMTFNAKAFLAEDQPGGYERIAEEIARHDADIVLLQDAHFGGAIHDLPGPLRRALGPRAIHLSDQYVTASRLPMRECRDGRIDASGRPQRYVRCLVTIDGRDVDLVNVHLVSPRTGLNAARFERSEGLDDWNRNFADRVQQARTLVHDLKGGQRPRVLAGDLNAPEHSPVVRQFEDIGLRNAFTQAGAGFGYTHGHRLRVGFSFLRIDHVLVGRDFGVRVAYVGGAAASDHRPVIADLWLRHGAAASAP